MVLWALGIFPDHVLAVGTDRTGMDKVFLLGGVAPGHVAWGLIAFKCNLLSVAT